ncbi:MAG: PepSY-like domain-containing protein [Bacteroides sp.]|nr:PepSY-like domain-containing protein [Bacteroides sp.]
MDKLKLLFFCLLFQTSLNVSAEYAPQFVQDSLKVLYPSIQIVGWTTDQDYYVAGFQYQGFNTKVWFDNKGHWVMKQTDWQVMDQVPNAIYHTFTFGPYSTDEILDVTYVEFPQQKSQVVIHLGIDNAETEYQLFYLMDGELINARNVTNMNHILGASTFL